MTLEDFNKLPISLAQTELLKCCGSRLWTQSMIDRRPFPSLAEVHSSAEKIWNQLARSDWMEAFACHPRIGEQSLREKYSLTADWSNEEQKGVQGVSEITLQSLVDGNRQYEARFGFIFLVCATGKSADEMLAILNQRLKNDPKSELQIAAEEHKKITRIRLEKLLTP